MQAILRRSGMYRPAGWLALRTAAEDSPTTRSVFLLIASNRSLAVRTEYLPARPPQAELDNQRAQQA